MKLAVKIRLQDIEEIIRYIETYKIPLAPQLTSTEIEEEGVSEIIDKLYFFDLSYAALLLSMKDYRYDILEKTLLIADELGIRYVSANIPLEVLRFELSPLFDLFSSYKNGLCIETTPENVEKVKNILLKNIGGVFWIKVTPNTSTTTDKLKDALNSSMRLIKMIEAINFEKNSKRMIMILRKGKLNYYNILRFLSQEFYNEIFLIPYNKTIYIRPQDLLSEYNMILQFYNSIV